jgi:hypothetical protein
MTTMLRRTLTPLLGLLLLLPGLAAAQEGFTFEVEEEIWVNPDAPEAGTHEFYATLTNTQDVMDTFTLTLEDDDPGTDMPASWTTSICTQEGCAWVGFRSLEHTLTAGEADTLVGVFFNFDTDAVGTMVFTVSSANTGSSVTHTFTLVNSAADVPEEENRPVRFRLAPAYPNPFNGATTVSFSLERPARVALRAFALDGRTVATLASGALPAGRHSRTLRLDGAAPSGTYILRLNVDGREAMQRVTFLK